MLKQLPFVALLVLALPCFAHAQVVDMKALVGRKAVAQRMPFYVPGTYQALPNTYAGKTVTIIDVKPSTMYAAMPKLTARQMASLPPASRENIENVRNASTLVVQFEDGTKADTGAMPVMPSTLSSYLEVLPNAKDALIPTTQATAAIDSTSVSGNALNAGAVTTLTDAAVQRAILGQGKEHATFIMDGGSGAPNLTPLIASITLFMPDAVLAMKAASAKSQYLAYKPAPEDVEDALMIQAHGSAGSTIQDGCTSVTRVVLLSDPSGKLVKEAYSTEPSTQVWRNGFGATNQCDDLIAKFTMKDVHAVHAAADHGEFYVSVFSGEVKTKIYKVKEKYLKKLGITP